MPRGSWILVLFYLTSTSKVFGMPSFMGYPQNLAWLFGVDENELTNEKRAVCETEACKKIADIIKENMDETVDPCEDFYNYTCGNWGKKNPLPKGKESWSFIDLAKKNLERQVQEIMESETEPDDLFTVKLGKIYFKACMDEENKEKTGLQSLVTTLARIGGWPLIMEPEEWDENEYPWQRVDDYYGILTGSHAMYTITVKENINNDTDNLITMLIPRIPEGLETVAVLVFSNDDEDDRSEERDSQEAGSVEIDEEKDEEKEKVEKREGEEEKDEEKDEEEKDPKKEYAEMITEVAMAIAETRGFPIPRERMLADANDIVEFLMRVLKAMKEALNNEDIDGDDNLPTMTLREYQDWYDSLDHTDRKTKINWVRKVTDLFSEANVEVDDDLEMLIIFPCLYEAMQKELEKTPSRTIVNTVHWSFISHVLKSTNKKMKTLHYKLQGYDDVPDLDDEETRRSECIEEAEMADIMCYTYVRKYFPDELKKEAEDMVGYVQKVVENKIAKSMWMNEEVKNISLEKIRNMNKVIGYPSFYSNITYMKNYYKGLIVGPSYFENSLSYVRYMKWKELRSLKSGKTELPDDYVFPLMLNAMYSSLLNTMYLTAADFQHPLYASSRPSILNYAAVGSIIGHEINHGFDDDGRYYDKTGEMVDWVDDMVKEYDKRRDCYVEQYNNFEIVKQLFNSSEEMSYGMQTISENIADSTGLEATLEAYHLSRQAQKDKSEEVLPGLEKFTSDQLFFITTANMYCEVMGPDELRRSKYDSHSIGKLRIIGSIQNTQKFAESFNCPVGSPMNPEKKCDIWG